MKKIKNFVLFVSIIFGVNCFSQNPSADLFQTWSLVFLQNNDLAPSYNISTAPTPITPTLTISNNLDFIGQGACNTFSGSFSAATTSSSWQTNSFSSSTTVCSPPIYNSFEESYFNFLVMGGWYQIIPMGSGLGLTMQNPIFGQAIFQNFPLKSKDFEAETIAIHPNPTNSKIFLNFNRFVISKIQIINSIGQNIKTVENDFEVLDLSDYTSGIYLLKIYTEIGIIYKRIIKE